MLDADEEKVNLELTGWELEELFQALVLKREMSRLVSDIDDYRLLERVESLLNAEGVNYCKEKAEYYSQRYGRVFVEYGRLEQFQYDHGWNAAHGGQTPFFLTEHIYDTLKSGLERRLSVEIEYEEPGANGQAVEVRRLIDVYSMSKGYIEARCHSGCDTRIFRADRILDARLTLMTYQLPDGFAPKV